MITGKAITILILFCSPSYVWLRDRIPGSTIGYGYDMTFANPYLSVDPGVRACPLNLTYINNYTTDDEYYFMPD